MADEHRDEGFGVEERSIDALRQKMQSRQRTSRALTRPNLARIDAIDDNGPRLPCRR
jgi:hypothetical protein